jgi:hypothetical protein
MGLPEEYKLPENYNEAYHAAGDGLAVPAVRFLAANLLEPALESFSQDLGYDNAEGKGYHRHFMHDIGMIDITETEDKKTPTVDYDVLSLKVAI